MDIQGPLWARMAHIPDPFPCRTIPWADVREYIGGSPEKANKGLFE